MESSEETALTADRTMSVTEDRRTVVNAALIYGVIHAIVDATCVASVFLAVPAHRLEAESAFWLVVSYDVLAFASQPVFGFFTDRWGAARKALVLGVVLTGLTVVAVPFSPLLTLLLAGTGNALFHLGAGAIILEDSRHSATPSGLFVAPGALGLAAGLFLGRDGGLSSPFLLLPAVIVGIALALPSWARRAEKEDLPVPLSSQVQALAVLLLMASIAIRAFVGTGGSYECPKGTLMRLGLPLAAFAGKALGGLIADRFGWLETAAGALLLSIPLIVLGSTTPLVLLTGMLFFQMTMPVTLVALARALPTRVATAFGLGCLALILGSLPTFFPAGRQFYGPMVFSLCILVSTVAVSYALELLNVPPDRRGFFTLIRAGLRRRERMPSQEM